MNADRDLPCPFSTLAFLLFRSWLCFVAGACFLVVVVVDVVVVVVVVVVVAVNVVVLVATCGTKKMHHWLQALPQDMQNASSPLLFGAGFVRVAPFIPIVALQEEESWVIIYVLSQFTQGFTARG
jgi:hypothetical protein